ncbi:MAG: hypothetical protein LBU27_09520 [Candidatus Peribacteria bacterium]|jgi:hypothetical protein|nr:hypothetical protein [Candidatus Peribacteria bacterium]
MFSIIHQENEAIQHVSADYTEELKNRIEQQAIDANIFTTLQTTMLSKSIQDI